MERSNQTGNGVESGMFTLEGVIRELHVEEGRENLLQQIDKHYRGKGAVTGAAAVAGDLFGQTANAAMLAMYDGENTQNFACLVDGQVVCGQFAGAQLLKEGHRVRIAGERSGDVVVARGILDEKQGLVWVGHAWGGAAEVAANWKIAAWCFGFAYIGLTIFSWLGGTGHRSFLEVQVWIVLSSAFLCLGVAFWANKDMQILATPSTEIFRILGFSTPEKVNLNKYQLSLVESRKRMQLISSKRKELREGTFTLPPEPLILSMGSEQLRNTHDYKQAIEDGKLSMASDGA
ncbi:hypothetical protein D3C87_1003560 [compost metagenome]